MKRIYIILTFLLLSSLIFASQSQAWWIIYNKPEYRGRIIDEETKQPIKGAVVVAVYYKEPLIGGPGGPNTKYHDAQEALTDEKGEFVIPAYTALVNPFYTEEYTRFIIYKAGYCNYPNCRIGSFKGFVPQFIFTRELDKKMEVKKNSGTTVTIVGGLAELRPLKTKEEWLRASISPPTFNKKDTPLLYKAINEERMKRHMKPIGR